MKLGYEQEGRAALLKQRAKRCVCKYCGRPLGLKRISFGEIEAARVEIFCQWCNRIEYGVEPEIYQSALYFVEEMGFDHYPELAENEQTKRMNVAKVCDIMAWENRHLGILSAEGFRVPLAIHDELLGECVVLSEADIEALEETGWDTL